MMALPGWITGGSATGLSATGAWAEPLPVIAVNVARRPMFRGEIWQWLSERPAFPPAKKGRGASITLQVIPRGR